MDFSDVDTEKGEKIGLISHFYKAREKNVIFTQGRIFFLSSIFGQLWLDILELSRRQTLDWSLTVCAADFSLLNLPKGKSLGRSKPATNS